MIKAGGARLICRWINEITIIEQGFLL